MVKVLGLASAAASLLIAGAAWAADAPDISGLWLLESPNGYPNFQFTSARVGDPQNPPLTPKYAAVYQERIEAQAKGAPIGDPTAACFPPGAPRVMFAPYPFEILQTPGRVTFVHEYPGDARRIFTDGRGHPSAGELTPTYYGHSIGRWEGDTLVVDTVGLTDKTNLDISGVPHSTELHIVERLRKVSPKVLEVQITVDDALALSQPWTTTKRYTAASGEIQEYVCEENNRNRPDQRGVTTAK